MHYVGEWTVALCYFRENVLLASDAPPADWARVVELVESVLERALGLPVVCACISPETPPALPASGRCASSTFQIFLGLPYNPPPPLDIVQKLHHRPPQQCAPRLAPLAPRSSCSSSSFASAEGPCR